MRKSGLSLRPLFAVIYKEKAEECSERKTLTSSDGGDILTFADVNSRKKALKKILENQKKCLTIKRRFVILIFVAANANLILEN